MPLIATRGAASAQGFGEFAQSAAVNYIEDVFSTYLYTGNGSTQTITNNIDLSTKGGLVWMKARNDAVQHLLTDTERGRGSYLFSDTTAAAFNSPAGYDVTQFNNNGFSLGPNYAGRSSNASGNTIASWTFRKQAKFFDVVTYTGTGVARTIPHNLGSVPGCIIVKSTSNTSNWAVYHRGLTDASYYCVLNSSAAQASNNAFWNSTAPTATEFSLGTVGTTNGNGLTYVAYLFAHDAGGFGTAGTDNVITCGSFTHTTGSTQSINLGYEPQFALLKRTSSADNWFVMDTMRGWTVSNTVNLLNPNLSDSENGSSDYLIPTATGFNVRPGLGPDGATYIYIAIRRGPMKTPTSGTSVFSPNAVTMTGSGSATITTNFPVDLTIQRDRNGSMPSYVTDRLRGSSTTTYRYLQTTSTAAESSGSGYGLGLDNNTAVIDNSFLSGTTYNTIWWNFRRAPSFMDVVCYTGNSTNNRALNHNLAVAPELVIYKRRNLAADWVVMSSMFPNAGDALFLQSTGAITSNAYSGVPRPTSTYFYAGDWGALNNNGDTYVAYLFASCPGVSKVGSYSGTGATQTISCGFAARFVLIKRTDSTGSWWVWDTARGMVSGTDPRLALNSTSAETNANWVYTDASGFQIVTTDATVNASGGTYIYLAIA